MIQILCWLSAFIGVRSSHAEPGGKSLLGMRLSEAEKTDFFMWFRLREIDRQKDAQGRTTVIFKPEGESVREYVSVKVALKDQDKIVGMQLVLSRSFADDRTPNGILARDISKSLLLDAIPGIDQGAIHDLIDAIQSNPGNSHLIVFSEEPRKRPDPLTPGYQAYLGNQKIYTKELSNTLLTIENTGNGSEESLQLTASLK
jgi:hypothetical protein